MVRTKAVARPPTREPPPPWRRVPPNAIASGTRARFMQLWHDGVKVDDIAKVIGVSRRTAFNWQQNLLRHGSFMAPIQGRIGRYYKLSIDDENALMSALERDGWMYQDEMRNWLLYERGVEVSQPFISQLLKKNNWSRKTLKITSNKR